MAKSKTSGTGIIFNTSGNRDLDPVKKKTEEKIVPQEKPSLITPYGDLTPYQGISLGEMAGVSSSTSKPKTKVISNPYTEAEDTIQREYEKILESERKQTELTTKQGVDRLQAQKGEINQQYDSAEQDAYIQRRMAEKNLPQQLVASGITGGAAESSNLGIQTTYENNINALNKERINRIKETDMAISEYQNSGDLKMLDIALQNNQNYLNTYLSMLDKKINYSESQQDKELDTYLSTIGRFSNDYQAEINRLIASGVSPEDERIKYLQAARTQKIDSQNQAAAEGQAKEQDFAWKLFSAIGVANPYIESVLGIKSGTSTADYKVQQANISKTYNDINNSNKTTTPDDKEINKIVENLIKKGYKDEEIADVLNSLYQ